jgi:hypothetical protein
MTGRHRVSLALAFLLALSASAAHGSGSGQSAPLLAGVTKITGSASAHMLVEVPAPASIRLDHTRGTRHPQGPSSAIELLGDGRFFGVALTTDSARPQVVFVAGQFGRCLRSRCEGPAKPINYTFPVGESSVRIKPGTYRLYVVTDGTPVRVKLRFQGLERATLLTPQEPADDLIATPAQQTASSAAPFYVSGEVDHRFRGRGMLVTNMWTDVQDPAAVTRGDCLYRGSPPFPKPLADSPGCAPYQHVIGDGGYYLGSTQGSGSITVMRPSMAPGQWHYGVWYSVTNPFDASGRLRNGSGAVAVFLGFEGS